MRIQYKKLPKLWSFRGCAPGFNQLILQQLLFLNNLNFFKKCHRPSLTCYQPNMLTGDNLISFQSTQNSAVQSEAKAAPAPQPSQQPATNTEAKAAPPSTEPTQASSLQSEVQAPPPVRHSEAAPPVQSAPPKPAGAGAVKSMEYPCMKNGDAKNAAANIEMK